MSEDLRLVEACTEEHFRAMSLIHALGWRTTYQDAVPADYMAREITDERWVPFFRQDYEEGINHGLLLYRGEKAVSCCTWGPARVGPSPRQSSLVNFDARGCEGWGELISFYTHPEEKGKGYGSLLMEAALDRLRSAGFPAALVMVLRENDGARRFYARHGFSWDGTHVDVPFPPNSVCVDLRYTRKL